MAQATLFPSEQLFQIINGFWTSRAICVQAAKLGLADFVRRDPGRRPRNSPRQRARMARRCTACSERWRVRESSSRNEARAVRGDTRWGRALLRRSRLAPVECDLGVG